SINRGTPSAQNTNATAVSFTVSFNEPVTGVDASDFSLNVVSNSAAGTIGTPTTSDNGLTWTVPVINVSGTGTFKLDLNDDNSIQDVVSNPLGGAGSQNFTTGQAYILDQTAPNVTSIDRGTPSAQVVSASSVTFHATFTEAVSGIDSGDFSIGIVS